MKINPNDMVRLCLTATGAKQLNRHRSKADEVSDGQIVTGQMWCLFQGLDWSWAATGGETLFSYMEAVDNDYSYLCPGTGSLNCEGGGL